MLTNENYFSRENELAFMGSTQYKRFFACEEGALAAIRGEIEQENTTALLVGSYVDAHFEGTLDLFKAKNPEIFASTGKNAGGLKSDYVQANSIIQRLEQDELFMLLMSGKKQVIRTGEIAGVPFKIKIDSLLDADTCREIVRRFPDTAEVFGDCRGAIVDLKCMKDFAPVWSDEEFKKVSFVTAWGYDVQAAIYQSVEGGYLPFIIAGATKEKETDFAAFSIPQDAIDSQLINIEALAPHYNDLKQGIGTPERCEKCDWCRRTKKLTKIYDFREVC